MTLQELLGLDVQSVSKRLRISHAERVYVRESVIPGAPDRKRT